ncbi:MAG: serine--tRNA ligase [Alphaproteobacteria bacterium RIFCSPLOWO2_01_FULL_40_26]|nr:MAG: serine--tRNA ligase [Alphaproteobacteria bacterium RIFCSPHIGHO2_02_FULL_40_34]OFW89040.1 MAG: serine--tRNA ligase [Alphaproteobacteria bacterium RIFCSPHIGHO2_01_FULL_40_8]OFW94618.1 MAG: serine--tRNA ligase [Alphaproteobacteria bacterium RIFCSPLOWO2_01_FULL_40_26]OFX10086.1 MAG: serine--tRNA ligase [Alphaproteobacteria bacterium RIFCSPLOWO2_02_FULL_40_19]OFX11717.1 MAG: serine--tRNA ligase [Alphaproteobacteria bacterium RIFCSPLOWO2_12_FULL_40_11]
MLDIKWIRENPEQFDSAMYARGADFRALELIALDLEKRKKTFLIQELQARRNKLAQEIAKAKKAGDNVNSLFEESKKINIELADAENNFALDDELSEILLTIPNLPDQSVPLGKSEDENVEIEKFGEPKKFSFTPKSHDELGEKSGMLDFEQSALMSGARFSTLTGNLAQLERALSNFMLDVANEFGYAEVSPPNLVKSDAMKFSGQLPKFAEEAFSTSDGYWLIPTSEVSLVNLVAKKTLAENELPLRFTSYTPCFRREAGSAGKDTRGMMRQHQFKKVELVSITTSEQSKEEHERMTNVSCEILRRLELPFRKILLCSGDMGFCAQKTYDLEVWLPSQNKYREISSCSNCGDFQARRASIKYKTKDGKTHFSHTLNGSALAVGRTLIAILENYQNEDRSITMPKALTSYMSGVDKISC